MFTYIFALLWALLNHAPNCTNTSTNNPNGQVTTMDDDTGGETGPIKPKPPTP